MKALEALNILGDLCASQKGMFTTAQAQSLGVDRMAVSRLSRNGQLEQVARGVYRASAAPSSREEDIYAAWLALDPTTLAFERPLDGTGFVASLNTAAWLQGLGELTASPVTFSHFERRQSRKGIRFLRRRLPESDIAIAAGMPVTTPRRTVLDLVDDGCDLSLVAAVLKDAESLGTCGGIEHELSQRAVSCGFPEGFDLYGYMKGL